MEFLGNIMEQGIQIMYNLTGNYGVAIILLTAVIRVVLLPFTLMQTRSSLKMQQLNPEIQALQKKLKNEPEKLNQETMALWKKHGVNPLSSCLLLLVQFPFIIAFFRALERFEPLKIGVFLGMTLGEPNKIVLPLLAAVSTYFQVKVSSPPGGGSQNQAMLVVFPLLIGWMATRFAAALSLYWIVSNVFSIGERFLVPGTRAPKGESAGQ
ncbi:MAG: YidC/Oxa1 family membrane protein insertase [Bacillota bacterium]|nr:YidC/Oxa1 family membrane protein insertase [Bacillota bacterium]